MFSFNLSGSARHETLGANTSTSQLTAVVSPASAHTKGSWVDLGTSSFAYESLGIVFYAGVTSYVFVDIGISDGSNRTIIAENLSFQVGIDRHIGFYLPLPLHVPSGSILSVRLQSNTASDTYYMGLIGSSSGLKGIPGYARIRPITDINLGTTLGVNCDPGGTAHTRVRTQLTASTSFGSECLLVFVGGNGDTARAGTLSWLTDIERGASGSENIIVYNLLSVTNASMDFPAPGYFGPFSSVVESGIRMTANVQSSNITDGDRDLDIIVYGLT